MTRARGFLTLALVGAALAAWGCASAPPGADTTAATAATPTPEPAAAPPWYARTRSLDLTGDGAPDTARLEAHGSRTDSLQLALTLVVDGTARHVERWGSSYELSLLDSALVAPPRVDSVLRARLDAVLASVKLERLDAPGVRLMAEDEAILAGLSPRPTHRVSVAYGFETVLRLAWDEPRGRFVRLWSCC